MRLKQFLNEGQYINETSKAKTYQIDRTDIEDGSLRPGILPEDKFVGNIEIQEMFQLKNLKNFPKIVMGHIFFQPNRGLTSLEGGPEICGQGVNMRQCPELASLHGIGRIAFKQIPGTFQLPWRVEGFALGLVIIKKLSDIRLNGRTPQQQQTNTNDWTRAFVIIGKQIKGERELLDCKEELIAEGLSEYGKL